MERGGGVARPAAEAGLRSGIRLVSVRWTPNRRPVASSTSSAARDGQILVRRWPDVRAFHVDRDLAPTSPFRPAAHQARLTRQKSIFPAMEAVRLAREHAEEQVQLGLRLQR